jgi:hypothetical protein
MLLRISFQLTVAVLVFSTAVMAQEKKNYGMLMLSGKVVDETKKGVESRVLVYRGSEKLHDFKTSKIGKFSYNVFNQDSVSVVFLADGYVSKTIVVSTRVPVKKERESAMFPFFIDLYPVGKVPSYADLNRPVGRIKFSGIQFIYDMEFTKKSNADLKEFVNERKELKIKEVNQ